ncbi:TPA: fructose-6-phosphate aldolase [Candidatus Latescibacteria bacterium]|nr:fructose-6-phosphate aldolase [Candidatus Latescibacterota bacterium]|tara:strand:- start:51 stop:716 length:666 start_codon:yes stop_codon:yes gene_type:complete
MKIFVDTADMEEIQEANEMGVLDGVTTNPTHISKQTGSFDDIIKEICEEVSGPVSAEVVATDFEGMMVEARHNASLANNVVVKIPITLDGLKAIKQCSDEGIKTNVTLCFSANQAMLAAKAGATYISPFMGRLDDVGHDGLDLIHQIRQIYDNYPFETEILGASLRSPKHVLDCALAGADVVTLPLDVLTKLLNHPLTDIGLERFLNDWKEWEAKQNGVPA